MTLSKPALCHTPASDSIKISASAATPSTSSLSWSAPFELRCALPAMGEASPVDGSPDHEPWAQPGTPISRTSWVFGWAHGPSCPLPSGPWERDAVSRTKERPLWPS